MALMLNTRQALDYIRISIISYGFDMVQSAEILVSYKLKLIPKLAYFNAAQSFAPSPIIATI